MQPEITIIIVYFKAKNELLNCLQSIISSNPKTSYEIIVVDNDPAKRIETEIKNKFSSVKYRKSKKNIGFGAGINLGAKKAAGKYLFILNPDTIIKNQTIDQLVKNIKLKEVGILAPQLIDNKNNILPFQCSKTLTPIRAIFAHSLINRLFPDNPISRDYWMSDWSRKTRKEVDVIQGSAFMIKSKLFRKLGGFDERYFMYFEENDLCLRVKEIGNKIIFEPKAKVIHLKERSTGDKRISKRIFRDSRSYYFKKNFVFPIGVMLNAFFFIMEKWKIISIFTLLVIFYCMLYGK